MRHPILLTHMIGMMLAETPLGNQSIPYVIGDRPRMQRRSPRVKPKRKGGHRSLGYRKTPEDFDRFDAAMIRRVTRAKKRYENHQRCLANNRCLG